MFVKLVVLILVVGSSGVGVLSVRQSRLQAAHETAEARLRIRKLENRTTELKAAIALHATPQKLAQALESSKEYTPAVHHLAQLGEAFQPINEQEAGQEVEEGDEQEGEVSAGPQWHSLGDGTEILIMTDEDLDL